MARTVGSTAKITQVRKTLGEEEEKEEGERGEREREGGRRKEEEEKTLVILKFPSLPLSFPPSLPPYFLSSTQHNMTNSML